MQFFLKVLLSQWNKYCI